MYLYLTTAGGLASRAVRAMNCGNCKRMKKANESKTRSVSQTPFCEKIAMSGRTTWQTKGAGEHNQRAIPNGPPGVINPNHVANSRPRIALPVASCSLALFVYVFLGAAIISDSQGWTFGESFYFCFVSLFTVGFGGLRPGGGTAGQVCVSAYLFLGVALMATCVCVLRETVFARMRRWKKAATAASAAGGSNTAGPSSEAIKRRSVVR